MRVFITGAAGYLGAELVRQLISQDKFTRIVAYDNFSRSNFSFLTEDRVRDCGRVTVIRGDVLDHFSMRQAMDGCDYVVHLAGIIPDSSKANTPHLFDQVNNWGSSNVVRVANEVRPSLVVFTSSLAVYGTNPNPVTDGQSPAPSDAYGLSKFNAEQQFSALESGIPCQIVRLGNLYGLSPQTRFDSLVNRMVLEAKYGGKIFIQGSGAQSRPILPVAFAASMLVDILLRESTSAEALCLATESPSIETVAHAIKKLLPETEIRYVNRAAEMPTLHLATGLHIGQEEQRLGNQLSRIVSGLI